MSKNSDPQQATVQKPKSAMGIASLVLGIIALLTSFLPFINNFSALLAFLGTIFASSALSPPSAGHARARAFPSPLLS